VGVQRNKNKSKKARASLLVFLFTMILSVRSALAFQMVPTGRTPYDAQMRPVQPILESGATDRDSSVSLGQVNQWMRQLRDIPYRYSKTWVNCEKVNEQGEGDCKGKALALYQRMKSIGATHLYLVIGKKDSDDSQTHVWLLWNHGGAMYNLDPTFQSRAFPQNDYGRSSYRGRYSYTGNEKFDIIPD
jgi:hypothetical protein